MIWCKAFFDILDRSDVTHECDKRTNGPTDRHSRSKCCTSLRCTAKM